MPLTHPLEDVGLHVATACAADGAACAMGALTRANAKNTERAAQITQGIAIANRQCRLENTMAVIGFLSS
jgi:hypothetical protein